MDAALVPCDGNIINTGTKMVVKMDGWREAEREREEFMPSRDDSSNTEQVKLCRQIASQQLQL